MEEGEGEEKDTTLPNSIAIKVPLLQGEEGSALPCRCACSACVGSGYSGRCVYGSVDGARKGDGQRLS